MPKNAFGAKPPRWGASNAPPDLAGEEGASYPSSLAPSPRACLVGDDTGYVHCWLLSCQP